MKLLEHEHKFSVDTGLGVYVEPYFKFDPSTGEKVSAGWRALILRRADILARGTGLTREHAFALAKARYEKSARLRA